MQPQNPVLTPDGSLSGELAERVLDSLASAVAIIDHDGNLVATNKIWRAWAQHPFDGLAGLTVGQNFLDACRRRGVADSAVGDHLADGTSRVIAGRAPRFEVQFGVPGPEYERWFLVVVTHLTDIGAVVTRLDTTTHHEMQSVVADLAFHDPLTGLPNRWLVLDRLRMAVDRSERRDTWTTVVFADVDDLKIINDTLGHAAGDRVLAEVSRRLRRTLRVGDTCGRWGGDEFVMVLELEDPHVVGQIVRRLQEAFQPAFPAGDVTTPVAISLGVAMAQSHASIEQLMSLADEAMYCAKRTGRIVLYTANAEGDAVMSEL